MSQELLVQMGGMALSPAVTKQPPQTQNLFLIVFGAGAQVGVLLPYSRLQESEADRLRTIFMAMAGYDPRSATGILAAHDSRGTRKCCYSGAIKHPSS